MSDEIKMREILTKLYNDGPLSLTEEEIEQMENWDEATSSPIEEEIIEKVCSKGCRLCHFYREDLEAIKDKRKLNSDKGNSNV